jgi:hypothetical protein
MSEVDTFHYTVLDLIYKLVKEDAYPLKCKLRPRDLILRSMQDWSIIHSSLKKLEMEELVIITGQGEIFEISITKEGLAKCEDKFE